MSTQQKQHSAAVAESAVSEQISLPHPPFNLQPVSEKLVGEHYYSPEQMLHLSQFVADMISVLSKEYSVNAALAIAANRCHNPQLREAIVTIIIRNAEGKETLAESFQSFPEYFPSFFSLVEGAESSLDVFNAFTLIDWHFDEH